MVSLIFIGIGDSNGLWPHLFETVLIEYASTTLTLMGGVLVVSLLFGVTSAWIITNFNFPFKKALDLILILPAACPAYLVAYAYTDFFEYAGPVQGALREAMGWTNASDYYFPEIRSLGGAIFVLSSVLYPYIYLLSRTSFRQTPQSLSDVSNIYGRSKFWNVSLPLARPAIVAGSALVCMEVISDFGTVEFFSLNTLTLGIFNVWIGMNNITAAAQISLFTFLFVLVLAITEIKSRAGQRFHDTSQRQINTFAKQAKPLSSVLFVLICLIPIFSGFILPISILLSNISTYLILEDLAIIITIIKNTFLVAILGSILIISLATLLTCAPGILGSKFLVSLANLSAYGYAFPGTMLAIGVLITVGILDKCFEYAFSSKFITLEPFFLSGTISVLIFAYIVRFLAVGYGSTLSGLSKISSNLNWASRTLSHSVTNTITRVSIPLIKKSIIAGGLLAFVDITKELPMTLLLRPFNFETLATFTYQYAHDELMGQAALPALLIILFGLVPIVYLNMILRENHK